MTTACNEAIVCVGAGLGLGQAQLQVGMAATWEVALYEVVRQALAETGAVTIEFDGHQRRTEEAVALAKEISSVFGVLATPLRRPTPDDKPLAASITRQVRAD